MIVVRIICFIFILFFSKSYSEEIKELQSFYDVMLTANKSSVLQSNSSQSLYYLNDYGNYNFFVYSSNHFAGAEYGDMNSDIFGLSGGSNLNGKRFYSYGVYYTRYKLGNAETENAFASFDYRQVYNLGKSSIKPFIGFSSTVHFFYNSASSEAELPDATDPTITINYNIYHNFNNILISPSAYFYIPITLKPREFLTKHGASIEPTFKLRVGLEAITPFSYKQSWYAVSDTDDTESWADKKYSKIKQFYYAAYFDLGFGMVAMLDKVVIKYDFSYRNYAGSTKNKNLVLSSANGLDDVPYSINYKDSLDFEITNSLIFDFNLLSFVVGSVKKGDYSSRFLGVKVKVNEF